MNTKQLIRKIKYNRLSNIEKEIYRILEPMVICEYNKLDNFNVYLLDDEPQLGYDYDNDTVLVSYELRNFIWASLKINWDIVTYPDFSIKLVNMFRNITGLGTNSIMYVHHVMKESLNYHLLMYVEQKKKTT